MRIDIAQKVISNPDFGMFLRENPSWQLELNRYPEHFDMFLENYKVERKKTFPDKLEKVSLLLSMMEMLL